MQTGFDRGRTVAYDENESLVVGKNADEWSLAVGKGKIAVTFTKATAESLGF